ncbi:aminopeptidase P family protein [Humisphaera borealis]|uniref:Aminopeptidase P family protein n=2 Tax=Humisphaera borealis TaxID=2807512 RepID=A0A7M2WUU4_9BACT|nr:aminopeptidase P family protein [Humisphaera borealis]
MEQLNLNGMLLTTPADLSYLTDFTGDDSIGLITADRFYLVTDFRYREQATSEASWTELHVRDGDMADTLSKVLMASNAERIGFEANGATVGQIKAVERALAAAAKSGKKSTGGAIELVPVEDVMLTLRKVKDDHEIALIRKSVATAEEAYNAVRGEIKVGQTESYLAALLDFEMRCRGASASSFSTIVASGGHSALPHYRPAEKLVQKDNVLLVDWGAIVGGYASDLTRTLAIGNIPRKLKEAYKTVVEAQKAAIAFLRPGVTTMTADRAARDVIEKAGFGDYFGHGLGHGLGRQIHELPSMRQTGGDEELRPGMVVTVEPGIYIPGEGGVRIEDDVLITHSGCEVLSTLDRSYEANHIE